MSMYNGEHDHFFEIKILPDFEAVYLGYYKKFNNPLNQTIDAIKNYLLDSNIKFQTAFTGDYIYKSLMEKYPDVVEVLHFLIAKNYFNKFAGQLNLTAGGWEWLHGQSKGLANPKDSLRDKVEELCNYLEMPPKSSKKIKILIQEINKLPKKGINKYLNLIAHQLKTILALVLLQYWEEIEEKIIEKDIKKSLHRLIEYTITNGNSYVKLSLQSIKDGKLKELVDDINHCNYRVVKDEDVINKFCIYINDLMSKVYGR